MFEAVQIDSYFPQTNECRDLIFTSGNVREWTGIYKNYFGRFGTGYHTFTEWRDFAKAKELRAKFQRESKSSLKINLV